MLAGEPVTRGEDDASLLDGTDAGAGAAIVGVAAQANFDEDDGRGVAADEVDLAATAAEVAREQREAVRGEKLRRQFFGLATAGMAWVRRLLCGARAACAAVSPSLRGIFAAHRSLADMTEELPALYVAPTPLGNLGDITLRTLEVLRAVRWVAAEDTRHSAPLLARFGVSAKLIACHEHNEEAAAEQVIARLAAGESVALVSDAGTPGISDPGARLVARVRAAGLRVVPLPGPCAAVTAFSAAGLADAHFLFYGFLPAKAGQREAALRQLLRLPYALVFYEAPHRIVDTVAALATAFGGERTLVLARELTKMFEQIHRCPLAEASAWLAADADRQRGEFVLIVAGAPESADESDAEGERVLRLLLDEGLPVKQAAKLAHAITGKAKNALYAQALELRQQPG